VHNITDQSRPVLPVGARLSIDKRTGKPLLLYPEGVVELSSTAHEIVSRCDGKATTGEIIMSLASEFEGETIRQDVFECLAGLYRRKLLELT
jgi:coenzyme PQQ biosynthesis protein PqqD